MPSVNICSKKKRLTKLSAVHRSEVKVEIYLLCLRFYSLFSCLIQKKTEDQFILFLKKSFFLRHRPDFHSRRLIHCKNYMFAKRSKIRFQFGIQLIL